MPQRASSSGRGVVAWPFLGRRPGSPRPPAVAGAAGRGVQTTWRERAQHRRIHYREDGRVHADAERQGKHRHGHKAGGSAKRPDGIAEVLCGAGQRRNAFDRHTPEPASLGMRCILVRDLTDAMYSPDHAPHVTHEAGTQLVIQYIERYWRPTTISADLLRAFER